MTVLHAKSDYTNLNLKDFDRSLEYKCEANVKTVGKFFVRKKIKFDKINSSPAKRTYETAKIICNEIGYEIAGLIFDSGIYKR